MTCEELTELLHDYVAGDLAIEVYERFERHRCACGACGRTVELYQVTIRVTRCLPKADPLPASVEAKLRAALGLA